MSQGDGVTNQPVPSGGWWSANAADSSEGREGGAVTTSSRSGREGPDTVTGAGCGNKDPDLGLSDEGGWARMSSGRITP